MIVKKNPNSAKTSASVSTNRAGGEKPIISIDANRASSAKQNSLMAPTQANVAPKIGPRKQVPSSTAAVSSTRATHSQNQNSATTAPQ